MYPEYPEAPTEGIDAAPKIYIKPKNILSLADNQNPNVQYTPQQPINQFINMNQSKEQLLLNQNNAINTILEQQNKIIEHIGRQKIEALQKEVDDLKHKEILTKIETNKQILQAQIDSNKNSQPVVINNNNNNNNNNINNNNNVVIPIKCFRRLQYNFGIFCLLLLLNIFFPGIGTIVAGICFGHTVTPNKTGELLCRGIFQIATFFIIYGWIWAVMDALNYFEDGHFGY